MYVIAAAVILVIAAIGFLIFRVANNQAAPTIAPPAGVQLPSVAPPVSSEPGASSAAQEGPASPSDEPSSEPPVPSSQKTSSTKAPPPVAPPAGQTGDYRDWFPDLHVTRPEYTSKEKVAYLTFDDGPSENTDKVLDVLKEKGVKATFFVVGREGPDAQRRMQRIVNEGHTIAAHSYTHDYKKIYASVGAYLEDFDYISRLIESYTGVKPTIFRFPGGTVNSYNKKVYKDITTEMLRRGYSFYDWNLATGDAAAGGATKQQCIDNVLNSSASKTRAFILCHDAGDKQTTAEALPEIIDGLIAQGFTLEAIDNSVKPITMKYTD